MQPPGIHKSNLYGLLRTREVEILQSLCGMAREKPSNKGTCHQRNPQNVTKKLMVTLQGNLIC